MATLLHTAQARPKVRPKVREDLEYFDQQVDGNDVVLVHDPVRQTYFRFNPLQAAMLRALDGHREAPEITTVLAEQYEVEIPPEAAERFISRARELMLLEITSYRVTSEAARARVRKALRKAGFRLGSPHPAEPPGPARAQSAETALFAEAFRQLELDHPRAAAGYLAEILATNPDNARAKELYHLIQTAYIRAAGGTTDFPTWVLFNPSRLLTWLSRTIGGFLFGWMGVLAMLAFLGVGAYAFTLISFDGVTLGALDITIAITIYVIAAVFHEVGHGLACQHYGGNVTEIGFMLFLYIKPGAYCDTSSSYLITNRRHKVMVQMGGSVVSLLFIAALAMALAVLHPSLAIYPGLALALIIESALAFITLIPFLKSDGYYAICDFVDFPNLRDRSFKLARAWLSERLLGIKLPSEELPVRTRRILIAYAVLSFGFTLLFIYVTYAFMIAPIVEQLRGAVLLAAVLLVAYALRNIVFGPIWNGARWIVRERRQIFTRRRTAVLLVLATAMIAPWFLPWPVLVDSEFVVLPHQRAEVRAETAGRVVEILVKEGDFVRRGEPLAMLRNSALHAQIATLEATRRADPHPEDPCDPRRGPAAGSSGAAPEAAIDRQLNKLCADAALLTVRSPIDGVVTTAHLSDKLQAMLAPGDLFAEVQDLGAVVAEIPLSQRDPLGEIAIGADVVLRPYGDPHGEVRAHIEHIRKAAEDAGGERRIVAVTSPFALDRPLSGLTGHARIYGAEHSLAYANLYLPLERLVRVRLWSMW